MEWKYEFRKEKSDIKFPPIRRAYSCIFLKDDDIKLLFKFH